MYTSLFKSEKPEVSNAVWERLRNLELDCQPESRAQPYAKAGCECDTIQLNQPTFNLVRIVPQRRCLRWSLDACPGFRNNLLLGHPDPGCTWHSLLAVVSGKWSEPALQSNRALQAKCLRETCKQDSCILCKNESCKTCCTVLSCGPL